MKTYELYYRLKTGRNLNESELCRALLGIVEEVADLSNRLKQAENSPRCGSCQMRLYPKDLIKEVK